MTTSRTVIVPSIANTLTTVYTNSSGKTAALKSVNINGRSSQTNLNAAPGGEEWSYFGTNIAPLINNSPGASADRGFGFPITVNLSADRLLFIWFPHYMHTTSGIDFPVSGGCVIHTQIVEYTGTKYRAGPIVNVNVSPFANLYTSTSPTIKTAPNSSGSTYGPSHFRAMALTPTKVVCAIRHGSTFVLFRLNISGNAVELGGGITNLPITSLFGTTARDYGLAPVTDNTDQVVVLAGDTSTWKIGAFNVPNSGAITALGTLFNTTISSSTAAKGDITNLNKTANGGLTYYSAFCGTAGTTATIQNYSYNSTTSAFAVVGTPQSASSAGSTWQAVSGACLSTGTAINGVFMTADQSSATSIRYYRQTSIIGAESSLSTGTSSRNAASVRDIHNAYNWGDERAVFVGSNHLVMIDSDGVFTELLPATDTTSTDAYANFWFNFQSRPIYSFYDPCSVKLDNILQYFSRTGMTSSKNAGVKTSTGNYVPWGHDYGHHYDWSEAASCWIVAQYGKIYSLSTDGVILGEIGLNSLIPTISSSLFSYDIRNLVVQPSGKILFIAAPTALSIPSAYFGLQWNSYVSTGYAAATNPVTAASELSRSYVVSSLTLSGLATISQLITDTDFNGDELAHLLWHGNSNQSATYITLYYGGAWQTTTVTSVSNTTVGSWNSGLLTQFRLIKSTPTSSLYPRGLWRLTGPDSTNSLNSMQIHSMSSTSWDLLSSTGSVVSTGIRIHSNATNGRFGGIVSKKSKNIQVVAMPDPTLNTYRVWTSLYGNLPDVYGLLTLPAAANTSAANSAVSRYITAAVAKGGYALSFNNTLGNAVTNAVSVVFDTVNTNPRFVYSNTSNTGVYTTKLLDDVTFQVYSTANVGDVYTVITSNDTARLSLAITSGGNTFYIANQVISTSNSTFVRTNDTYLLANGASVGISADKRFALTAMLSIVEED